MKPLDLTLYVITDKRYAGRRSLIEIIRYAITGGGTVLQYRDKEATYKELYEQGLQFKQLADNFNIPLIINDHVDIALAVNADGVHLGQQDLPVHVARKLLGKNKILGVSTHCVTEAIHAEKNGADYIAVGAIFPTSTKDSATVVGLSTLREIKSVVNIPIVAIGGINLYNIKEVIQTGADGIAVISELLDAEQVESRAKMFITEINKTKRIMRK